MLLVLYFVQCARDLPHHKATKREAILALRDVRCDSRMTTCGVLSRYTTPSIDIENELHEIGGGCVRVAMQKKRSPDSRVPILPHFLLSMPITVLGH